MDLQLPGTVLQGISRRTRPFPHLRRGKLAPLDYLPQEKVYYHRPDQVHPDGGDFAGKPVDRTLQEPADGKDRAAGHRQGREGSLQAVTGQEGYRNVHNGGRDRYDRQG